MEQDFSNKVALVTGATSGIGRATVARLAGAGAAVVATGRNGEALERVVQVVEGRVHPVVADIREVPAAMTLVQAAQERFGGLDILVNAAGILSSGTVETTTLEAWDDMFAINVRAVFNLMRAAVPALRERRGNIVNVSSVTGLRAFPGVLAYCVSKAAVDQLTRCASLELAERGVRVNGVNPGVVVTDIHRRSGMDEERYQAFLEHSTRTHPLGRVGRPEEVAELIAYLASDKAAWITGACMSIDGGRANTCAR